MRKILIFLSALMFCCSMALGQEENTTFENANSAYNAGQFEKAREVAQKFAEDSQSTLGKIKRADQGTFSIRPRDKNNPHIKTVRVVSTVEYYLSD